MVKELIEWLEQRLAAGGLALWGCPMGMLPES
jgi:hypothetical protein